MSVPSCRATYIFAECGRIRLLVGLLLLLGCNPAWSTEAAGSNAAPAPQVALTTGQPLVTAETLTARIKEVEGSASLDDAARSTLVDLLNKSLANLETLQNNQARTREYSQLRETAPDQVTSLNEQLASNKAAPAAIRINATEATPFKEIERELLQEKANLAAVEAKLADLESQQDTARARPAQIPELLATSRRDREALESDQEAPVPPGEIAWLTEARGWSQATRIAALRSSIGMLDQELLSLPFQLDLLQAQREQQAYTLGRIKARVNMLEDLASKQGRVEAREAVAAADAAVNKAVDKHPLVQQLAADNADLTREIAEMASSLKRSGASDEKVDKDAKRIEDDYRRAREQLEVAGLSEVLGEVLRGQRQTLPEAGKLSRKLAGLDDDSAAVALHLITQNGELEKLRNRDEFIAGMTRELDNDTAAAIHADLLELTESRRSLLEKSINLNKSYLRSLTELAASYRRLHDASEKYDDFLGQNLLWIRSAPPPGIATFITLPTQLARMLSPARWREVPAAVLAGVLASLKIKLLLLVFSLLAWKGRSIRRQLVSTGKSVGKPAIDKFSYTLEALGLTVLLALIWPLLVMTLGLALVAGPDVSEFTAQVSDALLTVSPTFFYIQFFSALCLKGGVAEKHFRWPPGLPGSLLLYLKSLKIVLLPAIFVLILAIDDDQNISLDSVERLSMIFALLVIALFFYRLSKLLMQHAVQGMERQRYFWLVLTVAAPVLLAILAFTGYFYTAGTLGAGLLQTLWIAFGLVVLHQVTVRWLHVMQRRLALQAARERIRDARQEKEQDAEVEGVQVQAEDPEIDLAALSEQTRGLISMMLVIVGFFGFWFVWSDILQAFNVLDDITLWHKPAVVAGEQTLVPVSLADLLMALLIAFLTYIAMKRLPPLLEILLLQRVNMTSGSRYTARTLTTYAIVGIGVITFFNVIGMDWSRVQWLFAALSVGIGFGLQEIVANFISGLIILFERPIRVGDVVTVGDTEGVVSRIQIRATTIRTWNGQELLVPNKEFITGRLLNWSLSDQITRINIPLGVAYGSDVQLAMKLMDDAARQHENIIEDPAPYVVFNGFGDNALQLELRCYVGQQRHRVPAVTALHGAINDKFLAAGISISFPQQDVHLDTSRPLEVRLRRDDGPGPALDSAPS